MCTEASARMCFLFLYELDTNMQRSCLKHQLLIQKVLQPWSNMNKRHKNKLLPKHEMNLSFVIKYHKIVLNYTAFRFCLSLHVIKYCVLLQLPLPDKYVAARHQHSVSTLQLGSHCMWLILFGGLVCKANTVIIELSEY